MDLNTIAQYLVSGDGKLIAAALLFIVIFSAQRVPSFWDQVLRTNALKHGFAFVMACIPAVAVALASKQSARDIVETTIVAFLGALGMNHLANPPSPAPVLTPTS